MQIRVNEYGTPNSSSRAKLLLNSLLGPVILQGFDVTVKTGNILEVSPGVCVLPAGVLLSEDIALQFEDLKVLPAEKSDYTLYYEHINQEVFGGSQARLKVVSGLKEEIAENTGTILAWIEYPGSGALKQEHVSTPTKHKKDPYQLLSIQDLVQLDDFLPFPAVTSEATLVEVSDPAPALTRAIDPGTSLLTTEVITTTQPTIVTFSIQAYVFLAPPTSVKIVSEIPSNVVVNVDVFGTDGLGALTDVVSFSDTMLSSPTKIKVKSGVFDLRKPYLIKVRVSSGIFSTAKLAYLSTNTRTLPDIIGV